jgi:hypothetical protein
MVVTLQTAPVGSPVSVAVTVGLFALFLALTAHLAARNVLGDVAVTKAFVVSPLPAALAALPPALGVNSFLALAAAVVVDGVAIKYAYGRSAALSAYITLIHVVISIILGTIIVGILLLAASAPA